MLFGSGGASGTGSRTNRPTASGILDELVWPLSQSTLATLTLMTSSSSDSSMSITSSASFMYGMDVGRWVIVSASGWAGRLEFFGTNSNRISPIWVALKRKVLQIFSFITEITLHFLQFGGLNSKSTSAWCKLLN